MDLNSSLESNDPVPAQNGIFIIEKIVGHRSRRGIYEYKIKWEGYSTRENTWEPATNLPAWIVDQYNEIHSIGNYLQLNIKPIEILTIERNDGGQLIASVFFQSQQQQQHPHYIAVDWLRTNFPMLLIKFYESRLYWQKDETSELIKVDVPEW